MFDMIKNNTLLWVIIFLAIVAPSFLVGAMRVVLYIILGIILLMFILSLIFRVKIERLRSQMENNINNAGQQNQQEGDVKIFTTKAATEKKVSKGVGDYVDFEEVKEE